MDPINNTTSSPPLQPAGSPAGRTNTGATDAATATSTGSTAGTTAGAASTTASTAGSSSITTLSTATQLQAAQAATASDSVFSTSKVNEIKQAISEGRFQVNSEKVADGLLDSVNNLLGARQRG